MFNKRVRGQRGCKEKSSQLLGTDRYVFEVGLGRFFGTCNFFTFLLCMMFSVSKSLCKNFLKSNTDQ